MSARLLFSAFAPKNLEPANSIGNKFQRLLEKLELPSVSQRQGRHRTPGLYLDGREGSRTSAGILPSVRALPDEEHGEHETGSGSNGEGDTPPQAAQAPPAKLPAEAVCHAASVAGTFQLQQAVRRTVFIEVTEGRGVGFRCGEPVVELAVLCVRQGFPQQTGGEQTGIFLRCFHVSGQFDLKNCH